MHGTMDNLFYEILNKGHLNYEFLQTTWRV